jgi:acyl-CoA oxidase
MPNISCGDIGSKLGANGNDNGWMIFNQARIPRSAMLSRFVDVTRDGVFSMKGDPRSIYQVMVNTRQGLVVSNGLYLSRACLIATRYAVCRK